MRTYENWKRQVDGFLLILCGMTSEDINDWDYQSAYHRGMSPANAARRALRAAQLS